MSTIITRAGKGSPLTNNEVDANFTNLNTDKAELSGAAFTGAITTTSTVDGRDVATDGSKLDGIEAGADVTDTTNVTAAGALMDSELTSIASVKALNQGVATTDSPTFAGLTSTGEITANGGIALGDNGKATFGAGDDLQLYHDGSNSYIADYGTGDLKIRSNKIRMEAPDSQNMIIVTEDAGVQAFYNGTERLSVNNTGIDVTGTVVADGVKTDHTDGFYIDNAGTTEASWTHTAATGSSVINVGRSSSWGGDLTIKTDTKSRALFNHNGDISFYEDTGTTPKFFWDASAESLGIGTSLPATRLHLSGADNVSSSLTLTNTASDPDNTWTFVPQYNSLDLAILNNGAERMRIDSLGNASFNTTDISPSANNVFGTAILQYGGASMSRTNSITLDLNRSTSDGTIVNLRKDGTTVGSIGTEGGQAYISGTSNGLHFNGATIRPSNSSGVAVDNTADLGQSAYRFKDLYLSGVAKVDSYVSLGNNGYIRGDASGELRFQGGSSATTFYDSSNTVERMRIDSAGRVGIGTSSPASPTGFGSSGILHLKGGTGNDCSIVLEGLSGSGGRQEIGASGGALQFYRGAATGSMTESMRIDASGNLLVGKTAANFTVAGHELKPSSFAGFTRDGGSPVVVNRLSNDGDLIEFYRGFTTVGSIKSRSGVVSTIVLDPRSGQGAGLTGAGAGSDTARHITPTNESGAEVNGKVSLGKSQYGFKDLYLSGGVYLGGTGAANKLDDYEEGTFNPSVTTSSGTISISAQQGKYVKVGDVVHYWIRVVATCTSNAILYNVDGLPFSTAAYSGFYAGPTIANAYYVELGTNATVLGGYYLNNTNSIRMHSYGNQTVQLSPSVSANVGFELRFEGSYRLTA